MILVGSLLAGAYCQTCLSSRLLSSGFMSVSSWITLTRAGQIPQVNLAELKSVEIPYSLTAIPCLGGSIVVWLAGAFWIAWRRQIPWSESLVLWGWYGWLWWCLVDVWEWIWLIAGLTGFTSLEQFLSVTPQFWLAFCLAGWLTTWLTLVRHTIEQPGSPPPRFPLRWLWLACGVYFLIFTTMNWRLYFNLLVPHGDSAMYEEHLWNLSHGKGFRSYLDQGLFLGEHIQFVHLFLLPLYVIWPSHLLLEACSSAALALGAFPVFWMVRRHSGSDQMALAAALAYLLYFPMQFLDIEIDLKTFRPESFGIPLLLLTLDQLDRKNLVGTMIGLASCLTVKEDYTLIFGPLGIWIACHRFNQGSSTEATAVAVSPFDRSRSRIFFGLGLCLASVMYLWLATRVMMPWFRSGVEVHYASYFARFGHTPEEIVKTMLTKPMFVLESFLTIDTALYAMALLAPLAFVPLLSPGRLAVGFPLFAILCLNELEGSRTPQHQFHAPLVAIVFWSLSAGIPRAITLFTFLARKSSNSPTVYSQVLGRLIWTTSLSTGFFFSLGPLGISFWDPGSSWNWRLLYSPSQRAAMFAKVEPLIPRSARVASTDFVHPRFTHHERSYDYSGYHRKVSGEGRRIPEDTDFIVIDTQHKYSTIKKPEDVPEWREEPDQWELIPDQTAGYFIVLKRKK